MDRVPMRVQLTAALRAKGKGFSAECLEVQGLAGRGPTIDAAVDELARRLKEHFRTTPPPVRSSRPLITPMDVEFTTYDLARLCQHLKRSGRSGNEVAAHLAEANLGRYSEGYLNNLARSLEKLHRVILDAWERGDQAATTDRLKALASLSHEGQRRQWKRSRWKRSPRTAG